VGVVTGLDTPAALGAEIARRLKAHGLGAATAKAPKGVPTRLWETVRERLSRDVAEEVLAEYRAQQSGLAVPDFTPLGPDELSAPVEATEFLVRGLWSVGAHGPVAGPPKALKSYMLDVLFLGVASGGKVAGEWPVDRTGPVLWYVGEGGIHPRRRRLQRIALELYGATLGELPVHVVPVAFPFNTPEFRLALQANLRELKPVAVALDSTYNYHPRGVNTADMYDRGQLFGELSSVVRDVDDQVSLLLVDHMRQNASLDLQAIAMAGVAAWANDWLLQLPLRDHCEPEDGRFRVAMTAGGREWTPGNYEVEFDLGAFDRDTHEFSRPLTVAVSEGHTTPTGGSKRGAAVSTIDEAIGEVARDHEWELTETKFVAAVTELTGSRDLVRERVKAALSQRTLAVESRKVQEGDRERTRQVVGRPATPYVPREPPRGSRAVEREQSEPRGTKRGKSARLKGGSK
jgi:hypothetical protein